jgi:hypothetical protein
MTKVGSVYGPYSTRVNHIAVGSQTCICFCTRLLAQADATCMSCNLGELTKLGRRMAEFPLDPQLAKTLLASEKYGVAEQVGP